MKTFLPIVVPIVALSLLAGSAWADAPAPPSGSTAQPGTTPPPPVAIYLNKQGIGVQADFGPLKAYQPCEPPPPNSFLSPYQSNACRNLQSETDAALSSFATKQLNPVVEDALQSGGGAAPGSVALLPYPADMNSAGQDGQELTLGQELAALPFMERRAALVAVELAQHVDVDYIGQVQNGDPIGPGGPVGLVLAIATGHLKPRPMVFDGRAQVTYTAHYALYSVDTGQLLRNGVIGPISATSPEFHVQWDEFTPSHTHFNEAQWTPEQLEAQGRIQDPRVKIIGKTLESMAPQIRADTEASLKDWPQVVQAANQLLAGQH